MEDTAMMSKVIVALSGVKTTLNSLAVRLELSWHVLRDVDSIRLTAAAGVRRDRRETTQRKGERSSEDRMMAMRTVLRVPARRGRGRYCKPGVPDVEVAETGAKRERGSFFPPRTKSAAIELVMYHDACVPEV
jgi:hypothetical protein